MLASDYKYRCTTFCTRLRPYYDERTVSRPTANRQALSVLRWGTTWESEVL
eukprot:SAG25_NODE_97_length_15788_cov_5.361910_19_plen_51_part_00